MTLFLKFASVYFVINGLDYLKKQTRQPFPKDLYIFIVHFLPRFFTDSIRSCFKLERRVRQCTDVEYC